MSSVPPERVVPFPVMWENSESSSDEEKRMDGPSDEALIADVAAADSLALQVLVERYGRLVMRIAVQILRDRGEAEEIMQEVFLYIYKRAANFDPTKGKARGWIIQLAYHRSFDRHAFLGRRGFYLGSDVTELADTIKEEKDLDREISSRLNRKLLARAFEELPERQRQTLELFYFDGLNLSEISEELGEPLPNVRHWYYRGLKKLQKSAIVQKMRGQQKQEEE